MTDICKEKVSFENVVALEERFKDMLNKKIKRVKDLEDWLIQESRIYDEIKEISDRNYIDFQCHNDDEDIKSRFIYQQEIVMPIVKKYQALLDKFFYDNQYREELDKEKYEHLIKSKINSIEIFRQENIELEVQQDKLSTEYFDITGKMTVYWDGEEKTFPQMSIFLKDPDRHIRQKTWELINTRKLRDSEKLDEIMNELIKIRKKVAQNVGLPNFRDYMFRKYERFSYTPEQCYEFHDSILKYVVPLKLKIEKQHQKELEINDYRPWDVDAVPKNIKPLKPFKEIDELIEGVIRIFNRTDKEFAEILQRMRDNELLDLESRKAKSPGGFCTYLPISKLPFIFMNAAGTHDDMTTLVHEGGHSIHDILSSNITISKYRDTPMEAAEFASMGMELLSMDKWNEFYHNEDELKQAKREHLEGIIKFLPWAMTVDKFQHWMYLNPNHTSEQRNNEFMRIAKEFMYSHIDWTGYEEELKHRWKLQLHIYEVPFYYIEYAIAQLAALQIWKQYKENPQSAIKNYKKALSLGNSKPLPEIYKTAGFEFDFSETTIKELMDFVWSEIERL